MRKRAWVILTVISVLLLVGAYTKYIPLGCIEVWGFITGAVCVLLVVEQNIWNFPVGLANNLFFIILFFSSRLYGDMGLQVVYIALGIHGWYQWLHGGANRTELRVNRLRLQEGIILAVIGTIATVILTLYLVTIHDAAPFLDALTTVLSLIAQYLLNRKRIENWYVWITADVIYIGLYTYKELYLTAFLYILFIAMCLVGLRMWRNSIELKDMQVADEVPA